MAEGSDREDFAQLSQKVFLLSFKELTFLAAAGKNDRDLEEIDLQDVQPGAPLPESTAAKKKKKKSKVMLSAGTFLSAGVLLLYA